MSSLAAARADNFRYPPDFDPKKHGTLNKVLWMSLHAAAWFFFSSVLEAASRATCAAAMACTLNVVTAKALLTPSRTHPHTHEQQ